MGSYHILKKIVALNITYTGISIIDPRARAFFFFFWKEGDGPLQYEPLGWGSSGLLLYFPSLRLALAFVLMHWSKIMYIVLAQRDSMVWFKNVIKDI